MAQLEVLTYPDPRLKTISAPVTEFTPKLYAFIRSLEETMRVGPGGVGIAAPQVGHFQRIVIVDVSSRKPSRKELKHGKMPKHHGRLVLINPEILAWHSHEVAREGCMSVPDYTGNVIRAQHIQVQAQDEHGMEHEYEMEGYEARVVQHELDHLDGLLFLDSLVSRRHDLFKHQASPQKN